MKAIPVLVLLAVLVAGCGGEQDLPLGKEISARATLDPTVHLFAEPVVARVEVVVDREHLDPADVRVQTRFLPYDVTRFARSTEDRGRFTRLRYEWTLRCLRLGCIPEILPSAAGADETGRGERRTTKLPATRILYDEGDTNRVLSRATWPPVVSVSRIKQADVPRYGFLFKGTVTPLPAADYRVSPTLFSAGLGAAALALVALPIGLVASWWRRRRPVEVVVEAPELTPLERALQLVEWARERQNGAERREALEVLAVELDASESVELAAAARVLAWSAPSPSPEEAERLVGVVRAETRA